MSDTDESTNTAIEEMRKGVADGTIVFAPQPAWLQNPESKAAFSASLKRAIEKNALETRLAALANESDL